MQQKHRTHCEQLHTEQSALSTDLGTILVQGRLSKDGSSAPMHNKATLKPSSYDFSSRTWQSRGSSQMKTIASHFRSFASFSEKLEPEQLDRRKTP